MRTVARRVLPAATLTVLAVRPAAAQAPGLPVLPSAFVGRGASLAANAGMESGERTAVGGAAAYGGGGGRWQVAAGAAALLPGDSAYRSPGLTLGARGTVAVLARERLGLTAFAGYGRSSVRTKGAVSGSAATLVTTLVPVGIAAGYRGAFGARRAWAVSVAPMYLLQREAGLGVTGNASRVRVALAAELALSRRVGVVLGAEAGGTGDDRTGAGAASQVPVRARGAALGFGVAIAR